MILLGDKVKVKNEFGSETVGLVICVDKKKGECIYNVQALHDKKMVIKATYANISKIHPVENSSAEGSNSTESTGALEKKRGRPPKYKIEEN
jgi:hypothetical protein